MDKQLFGELPLSKREQYLEDNCTEIKDNYSYTRPLTGEELDQSKDLMLELSISWEDLNDEFTDIKKEYKAKLKELNTQLKEKLEELRFKAKSIKGRVYLIDYQEDGMMGIYDPEGRLIGSRPLTLEERQTSIFTVKKKGTDDE